MLPEIGVKEKKSIPAIATLPTCNYLSVKLVIIGKLKHLNEWDN